MNNKSFIITTLALISLIVYLFVSAPPPLPEEESKIGQTVPIERVLAIAEAENDVVRGLWTKEIVGEGQKVGLLFSEDWHQEHSQDNLSNRQFLVLGMRGTSRTPLNRSAAFFMPLKAVVR